MNVAKLALEFLDLRQRKAVGALYLTEAREINSMDRSSSISPSRRHISRILTRVLSLSTNLFRLIVVVINRVTKCTSDECFGLT